MKTTVKLGFKQISMRERGSTREWVLVKLGARIIRIS